MARTNQFSAQQVIDALKQTKGMTTLAARKLKCSSNTIRRYIREYPTVAEAFQEATALVGDDVETALYDEAIKKRNTAALIFLAKTKFKDRGYTERLEIDVRYVQMVKQIEDLSKQQGIEAGDLFNDLIAELSTADSPTNEGEENGTE